MANETTTSQANDIYFAPYVVERVLEEARPLNVSWPLFRAEGPHPALQISFPIQDDPGPASTTPLTEGTGASNTALTTSAVTCTAATYGQMATVTDELQAAAIPDATDWFAAVLGRSIGENIETIHAANYANFSNVVGSSGTDLTLIQFITALNGLLSREAVGQVHMVLHPQQLLDLQAGSGNTPGGVLTALSSGTNYLANPNADLNIMDATQLGGFQGTLFGAGVFVTTAVATANAAADRAGACFVSDALGRFEVWGPRIEFQRNAAMPGTSIVATARYGTCEIRDAWGTSIVTDA